MFSKNAIATSVSFALFCATLCFTSAFVAAQAQPATGLVPGVVTEKMTDDEAISKVSYIIGYNTIRKMMFDMKQQGIELNNDRVMQGAMLAIGGKELDMKPDEMKVVMAAMQGVVERKRAEMIAEMKVKAETNKAAGEAFMAENAKKAGVESLENGVQYSVITPGTGEMPAATDQVKLNYHGMLVDGTVFDSSIEAMNGNEPAPITHSASGFVPGFNAVVQKMKVGGKWKAVIPAAAAYGLNGPMGPNQTLIFEIELLEVIKGK